MKKTYHNSFQSCNQQNSIVESVSFKRFGILMKPLKSESKSPLGSYIPINRLICKYKII